MLNLRFSAGLLWDDFVLWPVSVEIFQYGTLIPEMCSVVKLTHERKKGKESHQCISVCAAAWGGDHARAAVLFPALLVVEKVANESQKTPRDVVMMENFHHIFATLSRLKISCLEAEKKEAKQKYTDHLQSYVIYSLGQPLEKLNVSVSSLASPWL